MRRLLLALQFLTRLPLPAVRADAEDFAKSMRWFPLAGLVVGAAVAGAWWLGSRLGDPWLAALLGLAAWTGMTGALHLDGLGDIADAAGAAHKSRERMLEVLADPHIGSFGAVAIGVQLIAKLVLLHGLVAINAFPAIALIPFAARVGPLLWTRWLPDLHPGLAARFRDVVRPVDLALWTLAWLGAGWFSPSLLVTPVLLFGWAAWLWRKLGGISGDGHGGGIEVTETGLLLAALILTRLA